MEDTVPPLLGFWAVVVAPPPVWGATPELGGMGELEEKLPLPFVGVEPEAEVALPPGAPGETPELGGIGELEVPVPPVPHGCDGVQIPGAALAEASSLSAPNLVRARSAGLVFRRLIGAA